MSRGRIERWNLVAGFLLVAFAATALGQEVTRNAAARDDIAERRLELMRGRVEQMRFRSDRAGFPSKLEPEPLFRYDDLARRYVDGTVWRLGATGRPLAIVTAELAPDYYGAGPRIVYDLLSLSDVPFRAASGDVPNWSPRESAVAMHALAGAPAPESSATRRLFQMKQLAKRFVATQDVDGEHLELRLLPRPIDRYEPAPSENADGAIFLFVAGRMPGVLLLIETDGRGWRYGVGRLSGPSELIVELDGVPVWKVPRASYQWDQPYTATNAPVEIPGYEG